MKAVKGFLLICYIALVIHVVQVTLRDSHFIVWQLPGSDERHRMSYVVEYENERLFVIDGGRKADAEYLHSFLMERGGKITGWFITHPHDDHVGALIELLMEPRGLEIDAVYGSFLEELFMELCQQNRVENYRQLEIALAKSQVELIRTRPGLNLKIGHTQIKVLSDINPEISHNCMNNSSIVYKFSDLTKTVLFLGDLGVEGGRKLLLSEYGDQLNSDYVQMAHHGQHGVNFEFYKKISPKGCLWPTPEWLWNNDGGKGFNTGPWDTVRVRKWMDKLGVKEHYKMFDGLQAIQ